MRVLPFQKAYLLSFSIFFLSSIITTNVPAVECRPGSIHPPDYGFAGGGCHLISGLSDEQKAALTVIPSTPTIGTTGAGASAGASARASAGAGASTGTNPPLDADLNTLIPEQLEGPINTSGLEERHQHTRRLRKAIEAESETRAEQEEAINACDGAHGSIWKGAACNTSLVSPAVRLMLELFKSKNTNGDIKAACEEAKKLNKWAAGINAGTFATCMTFLTRCTRACTAAAQFDPTAAEKAEACASKRTSTALIALPTLALNIAQVLKSGECTDGPTTPSTRCGEISLRLQNCAANAQASGSNCTEINRELRECIAGAQQQGQCPGLVGDELTQCLGINRVGPPGTIGVPKPPALRNGKKNTPNLTAGLSDPSFNPDDHLDELDEEIGTITSPEYTGNGDAPINSASLAPSGAGIGGGGGFGGLPGGFGGAAGEGEGEDEGPYEENVDPGIDTNILGDVSNSRGASSNFGGNGYQGKKGFGFGKNPKGFALPKGLFGNKKANKARGVAGIGGVNEVSSANGLSNFQKISRAMNDRRRNVFK